MARFGGEEFAAVLPDTDPESAHHVAELLRSAVEELCMDHQLSDKGGKVTVSLGAASMSPSGGKKMEALTAASDAALYRAKRNGRDRVALAKIEEC